MFPLLNLPKNALNNLLKTMDKLSLMFISLLSKRTKALVKCLKFEVKHFIIDLKDTVFLRLKFKDCDEIDIYLDRNGNSDDLGMLHSDRITARLKADFHFHKKIFFYWEDFESSSIVRKLIDHLRCVFNYQYIDLNFFELRTLCYSLESIARTLKGIPIQILRAADLYDVFKRVLHYFPIARVLQFTRRNVWERYPAPCPEFMAKLLIQNFDGVLFGSSIPITLDNLLTMNTPYIDSSALKLSDRESNMYIRFWMNNSTSKLEYLKLGVSPHLLPEDPDDPPFREFNKGVIFKGIGYTERSNNLRRIFKFKTNFRPHLDYPTHVVEGGFDITRRDGTTCTILLWNFFGQLAFEMFVWP